MCKRYVFDKRTDYVLLVLCIVAGVVLILFTLEVCASVDRVSVEQVKQ